VRPVGGALGSSQRHRVPRQRLLRLHDGRDRQRQQPAPLETRDRENCMGITSKVVDGIAEVVMDNPPVNALTVAGWYELADVITSLGRDPEVRVVVLRAEGRGFNAGVDIKEMQATE